MRLQQYDKNGDGFITVDELREALAAHYPHAGGDAKLDRDVRDVLRRADQDQDGRIDYTEFCKMMRSSQQDDLSADLELRSRVSFIGTLPGQLSKRAKQQEISRLSPAHQQQRIEVY